MSNPISFRQRLARNTAASMATNVWSIVLTVAVLPIMLHGLGARAFGVWVFLQTFNATTGWLSVPVTGLSTSATRAVATAVTTEDEQVLGRAAGATVLCFLGTGMASGLVMAVLTPSILTRALDLGSSGLSELRIVGLAFGLQLLAENVCAGVTSVWEGLQEVARARMIDALRKTAMAASAALAATLGGLQEVALANTGAAVAVTACALVLLLRHAQVPIVRPARREIREVTGYAGTVSVLTGTGVLHRTMDRTIAGVAFGPGAVALVEIANQVQAGTTALLSASTYPMLSTAPWLHARDDRSALGKLFDQSTRYSLLLTFPVCALAIVLAEPFLLTWVGEEYAETVGLTQVAVVYVLIAAPLQAGSNLLQGVGQAGVVLRASAISVVVNLAVSVLLVQTVGLVGVFLGTIVGAWVLFPILAVAIAGPLGHSAIPSIRSAVGSASVPGLTAAIVAGAVTLAMGPPLPTLLVGGTLGVLAASITALMWCVPRDQRREILRALRPTSPAES